MGVLIIIASESLSDSQFARKKNRRFGGRNAKPVLLLKAFSRAQMTKTVAPAITGMTPTTARPMLLLEISFACPPDTAIELGQMMIAVYKSPYRSRQ
ncbi:MAG: hypothetical protein ACI9G1_002260 [Pirellulaceae bacterium]